MKCENGHVIHPPCISPKENPFHSMISTEDSAESNYLPPICPICNGKKMKERK